MSRLLCCVRARRDDMGAALSQAQEGEACDGAGLAQAPPTMADVIRERKKKAGGAALGTLRRRIAAAARRPRDARPDRGCEHARFIRSVVSSWRLAEVFLLCEELEAGAALRDLVTQAELAREPAAALHADLARAYSERWWCDVELCGGVRAHRAVLAARCSYFRDLLQRHPPSTCVVPLDGPWQALTRAELAACVGALYAGAAPSAHHYKWEHGAADEDLDIISGDGAYSYRSRSLCRCGGAEAARVSRLAAVLGFSPGALHHDMRYLLESGEMADCRLSWGAYELPAHRLVLAARSRYFRSVMSRRTPGAGGAGAALVCVDEKVLPRRFAKALLHCAYTDQVDLSLIGRNCSSPSSANSSSSSGTAWAGVVGGRSRAASAQALDDACQLYEIARFLEMPIVVQGCEDAIIEALSADTLPAVLRWAAAPHASRWVQRQAMRYLRDEFPQAMAGAAAARLPRTALAAALASPFLQASEAHALRALLRWAERAALTAQPKQTRPPEPNVVWHTAHSVSRRGARRREVSDAALREVLAALVPHVRLEHLPPDHELLQQMIRRGLVTPPSGDAAGGSADAWLGRGANRPARCFLPHLDELKALLECQAPPEAELARLRRARYMHRIPDTLYMVAAARGAGGAAAGAAATGAGATGAAGACEGACVSPRVLATMRARMRELRTSAPAARALQLHAHDAHTVLTQIALRTVREMSLPDSCADLLLNDDSSEREREWESPGSRRRGWERDECCRRPRPGPPPHQTHQTHQPHASLRGHPSADDQLALSQDNSRTSTCRREPSRSAENAQHRQSLTMCYSRGGAAGGASAARLSARVPDVAMAPNANTHLLSAPAYAHPPAHAHAHTAHPTHPAHLTEYGSGGVLQLDLGDGATHTPRPGSRAARAAAGASASRLSARRADDDDLRAAIELSVMRAYSSFHPRAHSPSLAPQLHARCRATYTLPHAPPSAPPPPPHAAPAAPAAPHAGRPRASPSPSALSASNSGHLAHHRPMSRVGSGSGSGSGGGLHALGALAGVSSASSSPSASPSPRRHKLPPPREYRLEYGAGGSRGSSPGGYA